MSLPQVATPKGIAQEMFVNHYMNTGQAPSVDEFHEEFHRRVKDHHCPGFDVFKEWYKEFTKTIC